MVKRDGKSRAGLFGVCYEKIPFVFQKIHASRAIYIPSGFGIGWTRKAYLSTLEMMEKREISLEGLVTHEFPLTEIRKAKKMILEGEEDFIKIALRPWQ